MNVPKVFKQSISILSGYQIAYENHGAPRQQVTQTSTLSRSPTPVKDLGKNNLQAALVTKGYGRRPTKILKMQNETYYLRMFMCIQLHLMISKCTCIYVSYMHMFINCAMCIFTLLRSCHRMSSKYILSWRVKCKRFNPLTKGITYKVVWSDIEDWIGPVHFWRSNYLWTIHPGKTIMTMENQSFESWRCISYETWWVCIAMFWVGNYLRQFALNAWPFKTCSGFPTKNAGYLVWHLGVLVEETMVMKGA